MKSDRDSNLVVEVPNVSKDLDGEIAPPGCRPGTNIDMDEHKHIEEELRLAERQLEGIISSVMDGVISIDASQRIMLFNAAAERLFRINASEARGRHINEFIPERFRQSHVGHVERFGHTGTSSRRMGHLGTLMGLRADGEEFPIEASISQAEVGGKKLFTVILRDITDRKRAEEALQRQAALIDLTPTAIMVKTPEGVITLWNKGAEILYGWARDEALGRRTYELLRTEFPQPLEQLMETVRRERQWSGELVHRARDGRELVVQSSWLAQLGPEGQLTEVLETNVDVTEHKRFQQELEKLVAERTAKLSETIAELEHFSYTITHDMRAPLRAMQSFGQLLGMEYQDKLDEMGRDYLRRIIESSQRMDHLILDALNYTKVVRRELELEPVNVRELLRGMLESYIEFQMPRADIQMMEDIPLVIGNKAGLTQCFSNLLDNAVKFVEPGLVPKVRVWGEPRGEWVRLWVEDNGIGINPEEQHRIFTMFQRLSKEREGTGIGLALVQKVVARMKGTLGVESEPGKGSRFWVELKAIPPANGTEVDPESGRHPYHA
jgi:PAS domain S-box-containing protein